MGTIDLILEEIEKYRNMPDDFTGINEFMLCRKRLCLLMVTLSTELGSARKQWKKQEITHEIRKNELKIEYKNLGGKAEWFARVNSQDSALLVNEYEGKFYKMEYFFRAIKDVISELQQRISVLREESKETM